MGAFFMNNTRIILLSFGKKGYAYAAFNLAMSIKYYGCKVPIHLFGQKDLFDSIPLDYFDFTTWIESDFYKKGNHIDVSKAKINIVGQLPDEHNIYLDVDALALKDITPLIELVTKSDKKYVTDVMGCGKKGDKIEYDCWARHEYAWPFFNLDDSKQWRSIQSSWAYFHKDCKTDFYNLLRHFYDKRYPLNQLKENWAKDQLPDELLFSGVCAYIDHDPSFSQKPIFFGIKTPDRSLSELANDYYILSMYGNSAAMSHKSLTKKVYQDWYGQQVRVMSMKNNMPWYKVNYVMNDKIINRK